MSIIGTYQIDSAVAKLLQIQESRTATELGKRETAQAVAFERPRASNLLAIIGDSIAAGAGGGWLKELQAASGGRVVTVLNAGVGGNTSTQMLARIQADVIAQPLLPEWVIIEGVTPNDPAQGVDVATSQANIKAMVAAVLAAGRRPIVCLGPPSDTTVNRDGILRRNAWLVRWAELEGIPCWDLYTPVADPADGTYLAANTSDGTHLSIAGAQAIAAAIIAGDQIPPAMQRNLSRWATGKNDPANLLPNGCFVGDVNADGIADNWSVVSGLATHSLVSRSGGLGNWQSVTSAGALEYFASGSITSGFAVGDLIEFTAEFQITAGATTTLTVRPAYNTSQSLAVDYTYTGPTPTGVTTSILRRFVVPAGATNLALRVLLNGGAGTVLFGRAAYRNLTALGLA